MNSQETTHKAFQTLETECGYFLTDSTRKEIASNLTSFFSILYEWQQKQNYQSDFMETGE
jgi:hypothetical protein